MSNTLISDSFKAQEKKTRINSFAVEQMHKKCLPIGSIIMWNGSVTPSGWGLCNGNTYNKLNGTGTIISPDLRGKFVLSVGQGTLNFPNTTIGATGGLQTVTLTTNQMPSHDHTSNAVGTTLGLMTANGANTAAAGLDNSAGEPNLFAAPVALDINNTGNDQAHENMPPYYVLAYIIKL